MYHNSESLDLKLDDYAREKFIGKFYCQWQNISIHNKYMDSLIAEAMNKFDPDEIFINNFGRRIKRQGTIVDIDPLTIHCAILGNCICSQNADCAESQTCTTIPGYNYNVCKTINEIPEVAIDKKKLPPPFGVLGFLLSNIFTSAPQAYANCSILK